MNVLTLWHTLMRKQNEIIVFTDLLPSHDPGHNQKHRLPQLFWSVCSPSRSLFGWYSFIQSKFKMLYKVTTHLNKTSKAYGDREKEKRRTQALKAAERLSKWINRYWLRKQLRTQTVDLLGSSIFKNRKRNPAIICSLNYMYDQGNTTVGAKLFHSDCKNSCG